jgi:predicted porin
MAFAAPVFAQNSVTLYGVIDEGLDYTNNVGGSHSYEMQSGVIQGSRWGLKGSEDLGGGLKAVFQLENGFNLNNGNLGQGKRMFGRQAFVGLSSADFGTVTLGRQYDALVDYLAPLTANGNWGGSLFQHPYDNDNTGNTFRVDNTIKFASRDYAGFQFGATYSFSNATNFASNRQYSIGTSYTHGGLQLAAAFLQANKPGSSVTGGVADDVNFPADRLRIFGAGINYAFGPATVGFVYTNSNMKNPTTNSQYFGSGDEFIVPKGGSLSTLKFQNFEISGMYQLTPALSLGAEYVYTIENFDASTGNVKPKMHTVALMADYNLSKRTDVYVQGAYEKVAGDSTGTSLDRADVGGASDLSSSSKQFIARVGLRHKF